MKTERRDWGKGEKEMRKWGNGKGWKEGREEGQFREGKEEV